jgi:hypothetical protein
MRIILIFATRMEVSPACLDAGLPGSVIDLPVSFTLFMGFIISTTEIFFLNICMSMSNVFFLVYRTRLFLSRMRIKIGAGASNWFLKTKWS